ncbi:DUF4190 domain-containing protein [Amycolatopsis sp. NPDC003865]
MTDPSGDKDRPAVSYDPPPTADPAPYTPENYDPPASDSTVTGPPEPEPATPEQPAELPPGSFETPAAHIPGTPYVAPGEPVYQQPYPPAYGQPYGGPAPYVQPPYVPGPPRRQDNALAIGALVCSILGFCSGITAIAGLVMGHIALSKTNRGEAGGRGMATAAVIIGYVVLALWFSFFTTLIILAANGQLD